MTDFARQIIEARRLLGPDPFPAARKQEAEGGCGVLGLACSVPVPGRHLLRAMGQMHNRGNGKGGGIAAAGLEPRQMGVSRDVLTNDYLLQIAYLDPNARQEVEEKFVRASFEVDHATVVPTVDDYRQVQGLEVKPPEVWRYFVRPKVSALEAFTTAAGLQGLDRQDVEDEFVYQNSYKLNTAYYASLGEKRAFVVSHAKDLMVLKIVGYAEQVVHYYRLEELTAHVWIGHQRYPTKGRVWHPGGAHPFIGLHEALVHNGDFANYVRVAKYLKQRRIFPLFLTDTEVSVLLFDLWSRVYRYPLEWVIEAMAPTTERDFTMLPPEKQKVYRTLQASHIHGSPDGPWFFIVARNDVRSKEHQLLGITDTSMLRPQVFALQEGEASIGLIASEKQAIDAYLESLSAEDTRFWSVADKYWNARGGSYTDGGAFVLRVRGEEGRKSLVCTDKFGKAVTVAKPELAMANGGTREHGKESIRAAQRWSLQELSARLGEIVRGWDLATYEEFCDALLEAAKGPESWSYGLEALTLLLDRPQWVGSFRRSQARAAVQKRLDTLLNRVPLAGDDLWRRFDWSSRQKLTPPLSTGATLVMDAADFPAEGDDCAARFVVDAYAQGWRRFVLYRTRGQRFLGSGLGPNSAAVIHVYGSPGDYLASGLDGSEMHVHANGQDQLGQILKSGKLVVHGDVGQAFLYGAKGGEVYVRGNAAGRPLINAVGKPRVVINGTALDYLAESFMAGDPLKGGGFCIVNGVRIDGEGNVVDLETPYEGGNLFSLASGGAIYIRDPLRRVGEDQLNGGKFDEVGEADWNLVRPYLEENEGLFGVSVERLLADDGEARLPPKVYRKVAAVPIKTLIAHD